MDFIQWNLRGFLANRRDLEILSNQFNPSILALQETLLLPGKQFSLNNYIPISRPANIGFSKRGVLLFIKSSVPCQEIVLQTDLEAVAARVSLDKSITICSLYLSPSSVVSKVQLENLISQLPRPVLLLGDMNGHSTQWGSDSANIQGKVLEDFISDHDLCILNSGSPTFCAPSGSLTHVDLSLSDPSLFLDFEWNVHTDLCGSDHFPILIKFNRCTIEENRKLWKFVSADWKLFKQLLLDNFTFNILDSDDPIHEFSKVLLECARKSIPISRTQSNRVKTPWFDEECKMLKRERNKALRQFTKAPSTENKIKYQALRAKCRFVFKNKKKDSWKKFCSKLSFKTNIGKVWKIVNKIKGKNSDGSVKCLKVNDIIISDKKEIANVLADTFHKNSSADHYCSEFQSIKNKAELNSIQFPEINTQDYNLPFRLDELKEAIRKSNNSSPGSDEVHYELIRHLPEETLSTLLSIFNFIWSSGYFPPSWREAVVIPVPKPGKDHSNSNNYRPIALTSCLCKTMERMVYVRLLWHLENIGALSPFQCGFRRNHSTSDHLVRFESFIRNAFINGNHVVSVLFDLEKAYDTTWKHGILQDLLSLGFTGYLPLFIENFLSNRSFCVRLNSTFSDSFEQEMGVPQGSILSPLLFNLKVNNIITSVKKDIEAALFVDDFSLSASGKTLAGVERQLQLCINAVQKWVTSNGFKFSVIKSECIHFHRKRSQVLDPYLTLNGQRMKVSKEVKFLGVIFDTKLSFLPHLKYLKKSCQAGLNVLKVISHTDWGADKHTLLRLYRALVRPKLDYGCIVYGSARKSYLKMLDPIHHQGLRIALGAFRTSPVESLYAEAREPPLDIRRLQLSMRYYLKLKSLPENPAYDIVMNPINIEKFSRKPNETPTLGIRMKNHFEEADLDIGVIDDSSLMTDEPPWKLAYPIINLALCQYKKEVFPCLGFRQLFLEQCQKYSGFIKIYTDGSKKGYNVAAAAVSQTDFDKPLQMRLPRLSSIYSAELKALQLALKMVSQSSHKYFLILSDSLSSLLALSSREISHPFLVEIHDILTLLTSKRKKIVFMWIPSHVGIYGNCIADKAAKDALTLKLSGTPLQMVPYMDLRHYVFQYCFKLWQQVWSTLGNNKLFKVYPDLSDPLPSLVQNRKEETVLTRLHIGHSYMTHGWLLRKEDPPWCDVCKCVLSIEHIMTNCVAFTQSRERFLCSNDLKFIYRHVSTGQLFGFLRDINLFHKI